MRIYKFGGTSVRDGVHVARVVELIERGTRPLVVVTSAPAGVTDALQGLHDQADVPRVGAHLLNVYRDIAQHFGIGSGPAMANAKALLERLRPPQNAAQRAALLATGERVMAPLLAETIRAKGVTACSIDGADLIETDDRYLSANVDLQATRVRTRSSVMPAVERGDVIVVPGFVAAGPGGITTTLGRNGSDYSAAILGSSLDADEVWIWTDVDGIYTTDPRHYRDARIIRELSFRESAEAAYFGAKVVHPYTMWPLIDSETALRIKSSFDPDAEGTRICREPRNRGNELIVTTIRDVSVVTVGGYGLIGVPGIASRVFGAISRSETNVLLISQSSSEHNISFVIRRDDAERTLTSLNEELSSLITRQHRVDRIRVLEDVAILTVVGENMRGRAGIAGTIFSALGDADVNVIVIAQGSSEYSISIVIRDQDVKPAIDAIMKGTRLRYG